MGEPITGTSRGHATTPSRVRAAVLAADHFWGRARGEVHTKCPRWVMDRRCDRSRASVQCPQHPETYHNGDDADFMP